MDIGHWALGIENYHGYEFVLLYFTWQSRCKLLALQCYPSGSRLPRSKRYYRKHRPRAHRRTPVLHRGCVDIHSQSCRLCYNDWEWMDWCDDAVFSCNVLWHLTANPASIHESKAACMGHLALIEGAEQLHARRRVTKVSKIEI